MAKKFRITLSNSRFRHSTTTAGVEICCRFLVAPDNVPSELPFLLQFSTTEAVARQNMCLNLAFCWRKKLIKLFRIADFDTTPIARVEICESNAPPTVASLCLQRGGVSFQECSYRKFLFSSSICIGKIRIDLKYLRFPLSIEPTIIMFFALSASILCCCSLISSEL